MTGFAAAACATPLGAAAIELRSVNSRFLDLTLRIADDLRQFEPMVRETIGARIARGKVECRIAIQRQGFDRDARLNETALRHLVALGAEVTRVLPQARPLSVAEILAWPGLLESQALDQDSLRAALLAGLGEALEALTAARQREGAALGRLLLDRCAGIETITEQLRARLPELRAAVERKLVERLNQSLAPNLATAAGVGRDELNDRIRQEVTLYGLRADVDEELARLNTHVTEVRRVLAAGGAVGRRLDFLMQELNREANTLGSKATAVDLTQAAVELKLLIEQMREQIQNLE
jgi:uncharacterized protein (TIGR00255 family)